MILSVNLQKDFRSEGSNVVGGIPVDVPTDIGKLRSLQTFSVQNPRSIPMELASLPKLNLLLVTEYLGNYLPDNDNDTDVWSDLLGLTLPQLKRFDVTTTNEALFRSCIPWMIQALPNLEHINLNVGKNSARAFFGTTENWSFRDSLKILDVSDSELGQHDLENLLLDVLPTKLPNLRHLDFSENSVGSFQGIVDTIRNTSRHSSDNEVRVPTSIHTLKFDAFYDD